jgi:hypothetical protein
MNIQRPLLPGFLKKADQQLLLNKPGIWSTRVHLVLYYGLLFIAALALLCFLEPVDVRSRTTTAAWIGFVSIISVIGLVVWIIYLLRFNVFKKYGQIHPLYMLVTFLLYFVCTGTIVAFTYVHPIVESVRANMAFGDEEIVKDVNAINTKIGQLHYEQLRRDWDYDSVALTKYRKPTDEEDGEYPVNRRGKKQAIQFITLDSNAFFNRMGATDSTVKINDTLYLMYRTPAYDFLSAYNADRHTHLKLASSFEIYHYVKGHVPRAAEKTVINNELSALLKKYDMPERRAFDPSDPEPRGLYEIIHRKYRMNIVDDSVENLVEKKYRWSGYELDNYIRMFYYFALGISLLIFIFRHSTVRTFFLTLLTGVLLTILTALVISFARLDEIAVDAMLIGYIVLFFVGSLPVWRSEKRTAAMGILINLFVAMILVLPILSVALYYAVLRHRYMQSPVTAYPRIDDRVMLAAEVTGSLLLLILLATYIYRLYRRWYALPEH